MKYPSFFLVFACIAAFILLAGYGSGPASTIANHFIGAPGGNGTTCGSCHGTPGSFGVISAEINVFNTGTTTSASSYVAGTTYDVQVEIKHPIGNPGGYGFQLVSFDASGSQAGSFVNPPAGIAIIPLATGVEVAEHTSFNTSPFFTVEWVAPTTSTGDVRFYAGGVAANGNGLNSGDGGSVNPATFIMTPGNAVPHLTIDLNAFLEGTYNATSGLMGTTLQQRALFPVTGQPYSIAPWNYLGTEGSGWMPSDYPVDAVDWVLISLRTGENASTTVAQVAGLLLEDGSVSASIQLSGNPAAQYYVVLEHRNHLPVMSPTAVQVNNNALTYDFTQADSYMAGAGFGQKNVGSNWLLYGANGDQLNAVGHEITGSDIIEWFAQNGNFDIYSGSDFDMNGDLNANDRILFAVNNGIFSAVPR